MRCLAAIATLALALAGCGGSEEGANEGTPTTTTAAAPEASTPPSDASTEIRELENVLALRSAFEADRGRQRVLLLFSPT